MTPAEAAELLAGASFRYARTMPQNPHDYTLRETWGNHGAFENVVETIRRHGYRYMFHGRGYLQFNANGYAYWTMGDPVSETTLINRRQLGATELYDNVADRYDQIYDTAACHAEEAEVRDLLAPLEGRVLDIGCGTGLLLDLFPDLERRGYTGIDPSPRMIERMAEKHPQAKTQCTRLADFRPNGRFDRVIGLFGVVNYLLPKELFMIPKLTRPNGEWAIMMYKADYSPKDGSEPYVIRHETIPAGERVDEVSTYWLIRGGGW